MKIDLLQDNFSNYEIGETCHLQIEFLIPLFPSKFHFKLYQNDIKARVHVKCRHLLIGPCHAHLSYLDIGKIHILLLEV